MSDAKKCDRCGGYYDRSKVEIGRNKLLFGYVALYSRVGSQIKRCDLCDNCVKKLINWLDNEKEFTEVGDEK